MKYQPQWLASATYAKAVTRIECTSRSKEKDTSKMMTLQTDNTTNPHVVTLIERKTTMPAQEPENVETLANRFKDGAKRALGIVDDADKGRLIACQTYRALLSITNYPRAELSDLTLMYAFAAGVSDAICRLTKQEDLEDLTEEFVDAI